MAVAIGGYALDLYSCAQLGYFDALADDLPVLGAALPQVFRQPSLNALLELGRPALAEAGLEVGPDAVDRVYALEERIAAAHWTGSPRATP